MNQNADYYPRLQAIIALLRDESEKEDSKNVPTLDDDSDESDNKAEKEKIKETGFEEADKERFKSIVRLNEATHREKEIKEEFERLMVEFLNDYPDSPEAFFLIGRQAFVGRSFVVAWESFNKAWELDSTILEYADAIAITSSHMGKIKEGAFFAKLSLILQPHEHLKHLTIKQLTDYNRSLMATYDTTSNFTSMLHPLSMGEYSRVINILESEVQVNKKHGPSYYYLGFSYYKLGYYHRALENIRVAYLLENDNLDYLPLLIESCFKLQMYNEALGYLTELEQVSAYTLIVKVLKQKYLIMNNSYDNSTAFTQHIWNNIKEIEESKDKSKELPNYAISPYTKVYARIGILINSSTQSDTINTLISAPDKFHVVLYDVDDAKEREQGMLKNTVTAYKNLHEIDAVSSAMMIRGEALDLLIDATNYSANGSYNKYAFDDIVPLRLSWLSHVEKPFIDGILYSDNFNKLDNYFKIANKKPYKIRNAISLPLQNMFATIQEPPAFKNGHINLGVVATKENLTPLFLSQLAIILRKIPFVNIYFGYNKLLTESYKDELTVYFAGLKLHTRIKFFDHSIDSNGEHSDSNIEFLRGIDIFLNGGKTSIDAMGYALFAGVPSFCLLDGTGESVIAVSTLASANADENRVCDSLESCMEEILKIIEDPEVLAKIRSDLIKTIPHSLLFNPNLVKNTFWEDIYEITQAVDSKYPKIS